MISILYPLPPEEYPSTNVPDGWYLVELRQLDDCVAMLFAVPSDLPMIESGEWREIVKLKPFRDSGNSVIAFICDRPVPPDSRIVNAIMKHIHTQPEQALLLPFPPTIVPRVLAYREKP